MPLLYRQSPSERGDKASCLSPTMRRMLVRAGLELTCHGGQSSSVLLLMSILEKKSTPLPKSRELASSAEQTPNRYKLNKPMNEEGHSNRTARSLRAQL